jgi:hypothetical protein
MAYQSFQNPRRSDMTSDSRVSLIGLVVIVGALLLVFNTVASKIAPEMSLGAGWLSDLMAPPKFADSLQLQEQDVHVVRPLSSSQLEAYSPVGSVTIYAFCENGVMPAFNMGIAEMAAAVGEEMGTAVECEHPVGRGQTQQKTTTGVATYDGSSNSVEFKTEKERWVMQGGQLYFETLTPAS